MARPHHETIIIGGGISGLSLAYFLHKKGAKDFVLLEKNNRFGGNIYTEMVDSCLLDIGPDSFLTTKPWAKELCLELGLQDQFIHPQTAKLYLARNERLFPFPSGTIFGFPRAIRPFLLSRAIPIETKWRAILEVLCPPSLINSNDDESVSSFVKRHFGQTAVDLLAEPILGGIYAGRTDEMSLLATFPNLRELEQKHKSLIRGFRKMKTGGKDPVFLSLRTGLGSLVKALQEKIPRENLLLNQAVSEIGRKDSGYCVSLGGESQVTCKNLVLTCSPQVAAKFLPDPLRKLLKQFPCVSTATIFLAYRTSDVSHPTDALGFVCPRHDKQRILASTWVSSKFEGRAPKDVFLLRCFVGGRGKEELATAPEEELLRICREELSQLMGIHAEPLFTRVYRWPHSSPQYSLGHLKKVKSLEELGRQFPNLFFIGNSYEGVGIPDCVRLAKTCSDRILP